MKLLIKFSVIIFILAGFWSCKKFVDISPPVTQLVGSSVYSTNTTAAAAVTGIYQSMASPGHPIGGGSYGFSALLGLSADEFTLFPNADNILNLTYANSLLSNTEVFFWNKLYNCIYQANAALEGLSSSKGVTSPVKEQLIGEVQFIRAFCFFYLVNVYGDVPLVLKSDYNTNKLISRSPQNLVYDQIVEDLIEAEKLLSENYLNPDGSTSTFRVRPNKMTASALLSRVYLYQQKWDSAEIYASKVIVSSQYHMESDLNNVFLKNSTEAIWQLEPANTGFNAPDADFVIGYLYYGGPSAYTPFLINGNVVNSFDSLDLRKANWTVNLGDYYFPYKYKLYYTGQPPEEYPTVLRLAEQYLIRAEAKTHLSDLVGATADLNVIRNRAGLQNTTASTEEALTDAIAKERRLELFAEYGHRWLDLKRTGQVDEIMSEASALKGGTWESTDQLYPIPLRELLADPNLTQNPGYQ
jgi:starch-binding outer membrane protein, SusD/RagB family